MFLENPVFFFQEDFQAITYGFKFATQVTETRAAGLWSISSQFDGY